MYRIYKAMATRFENFFLTQAILEQDALAGSTEIVINDTSPFTKQAINNSFPEIFLLDSNSSFKLTPTGREGAEIVRVKEIIDDKKIILQQPLTRDFLVSNKAYARRAIISRAGGTSGDLIDKVYIGDVEVIKKFGAISIIPSNKTINWRTLSSTIDKVSIDFVVYVKQGDTEKATESVLILADIVEWILMSNLHIQPIGYKNPWERTNIARVTNVQYGTIAKGSEFLKAATLTWEADMHFFRGYLTQQGRDDSINYGYGNLENLGPLPQK